MRIGHVAAVAVLFILMPAWGEPPAIRDFDIATIEALGQRIYQQDQEAWKATDVLIAVSKINKLNSEGAKGWLVGTKDGHDVVRFVRIGTNGPESFYDVVFDGELPLEMYPPQNTALSDEELAQYRARQLALSEFDFHCTNGHPNTVALKDPQGDGWLVWVMSATFDPKLMILGGHMRFTISPDGRKVQHADKLSVGCITFPVGEVEPGLTRVGAGTTSIVSLKPLETHVFASLSYKTPVYVSTNDGMTWKVSEGRISTVEADAPPPDGAMARRFAGSHEACLTLLKSGDANDVTVGDKVQLINSTEERGPFRRTAPTGKRISGYICVRQDLVPSPNDYKVVQAGYALYIEDRGEGHGGRSIVLWLKDGKVQYRVEEGLPLTPDLKTRIEKRLEQMQKDIDKAG